MRALIAFPTDTAAWRMRLFAVVRVLATVGIDIAGLRGIKSARPGLAAFMITARKRAGQSSLVHCTPELYEQNPVGASASRTHTSTKQSIW